MADGGRAKKNKPSEADDLALVWGASADGETLGVLRKRGEAVEPALVTKVAEGMPIRGELVRLRPRAEPLLYDVDVLYDGREEGAASKPANPEAVASRGEASREGPAKVATDAYRKGWDRLFQKPRKGSAAN